MALKFTFLFLDLAKIYILTPKLPTKARGRSTGLGNIPKNHFFSASLMKKCQKIWAGQPPSFVQNPKKQQFFFVSPSLTPIQSHPRTPPNHPRSPSKAKAVSRAEMSTSSHFFLSFAGFDDLDLMWQFLPNFTILTRFDILTILNNFCTTKKSFTWGWFIYIAFTDLRIKATQKIHQK